MGTAKHAPRRGQSAADTVEISALWAEYASTPPPRTRHRRRRAPVPVQRPMQIGLYGVVLTGLVGGTAAWASMEKNIEIQVDGHTQHVHTYSGSVSGALKAADVEVGPHDAVLPGKNASISDGSHIVIDRGRPVDVTLDGTEKKIWVTSNSVKGVLTDLDLPAQGTYTSEPLAAPLSLSGNDLTVRTQKAVTLVADGHRRTVQSSAATVGQFLQDSGIDLSSTDRVTPGRSAAVSAGMTVAVTRIRYSTEVQNTTLDYDTKKVDDDTLPKGNQRITQRGHTGTERLTYTVSYVNGKRTGRKLASRTVVAKPVTEIVHIGTKPIPPSETTVPAPSSRDWDAVAACESSGDWSINSGNGYYGGLQFDISTWLANGGGVYAPRPDLASKAQQIAIADKVANARGSSPWPVCGTRMYQ